MNPGDTPFGAQGDAACSFSPVFEDLSDLLKNQSNFFFGFPAEESDIRHPSGSGESGHFSLSPWPPGFGSLASHRGSTHTEAPQTSHDASSHLFGYATANPNSTLPGPVLCGTAPYIFHEAAPLPPTALQQQQQQQQQQHAPPSLPLTNHHHHNNSPLVLDACYRSPNSNEDTDASRQETKGNGHHSTQTSSNATNWTTANGSPSVHHIFDPEYKFIYDVPSACVVHLPPARLNITRLVLCRNYRAGEPGSCGMAGSCKFVHADCVPANLEAHPIHVNYIWRSADCCGYPRLSEHDGHKYAESAILVDTGNVVEGTQVEAVSDVPTTNTVEVPAETVLATAGAVEAAERQERVRGGKLLPARGTTEEGKDREEIAHDSDRNGDPSVAAVCKEYECNGLCLLGPSCPNIHRLLVDPTVRSNFKRAPRKPMPDRNTHRETENAAREGRRNGSASIARGHSSEGPTNGGSSSNSLGSPTSLKGGSFAMPNGSNANHPPVVTDQRPTSNASFTHHCDPAHPGTVSGCYGAVSYDDLGGQHPSSFGVRRGSGTVNSRWPTPSAATVALLAARRTAATQQNVTHRSSHESSSGRNAFVGGSGGNPPISLCGNIHNSNSGGGNGAVLIPGEAYRPPFLRQQQQQQQLQQLQQQQHFQQNVNIGTLHSGSAAMRDDKAVPMDVLFLVRQQIRQQAAWLRQQQLQQCQATSRQQEQPQQQQQLSITVPLDHQAVELLMDAQSCGTLLFLPKGAQQAVPVWSVPSTDLLLPQ